MSVLRSGLEMVFYYLSSHTLTCLIPAFFIAGAIAAFIKKDAIIKYLGPDVKKKISYPIASISGAVLAVCSCTILPMFAGLYKKGSGVGPSTAFLYSGPAINILAIVYTASELGYQIGLARAIAAVATAFVIAFLMSYIFKSDDEGTSEQNSNNTVSYEAENERPIWIKLTFFGLLVAILLIGASASIDRVFKAVLLISLIALLILLLRRRYETKEVKNWGSETWFLTKKIFPILIIGTFIVGIIEFYVPPETFRPYLGNDSLFASFLGSIIGGILYMPTLLEVPIIGTTFGYGAGVMGEAPALSLLLAGPSLSLPNMIVLFKIMKFRHWLAYILIVVFLSTLMGFTYGIIVS